VRQLIDGRARDDAGQTRHAGQARGAGTGSLGAEEAEKAGA
jgi:hypothetical protein